MPPIPPDSSEEPSLSLPGLEPEGSAPAAANPTPVAASSPPASAPVVPAPPLPSPAPAAGNLEEDMSELVNSDDDAEPDVSTLNPFAKRPGVGDSRPSILPPPPSAPSPIAQQPASAPLPPPASVPQASGLVPAPLDVPSSPLVERAPLPDREQLLKQAAEAPDTTLILPTSIQQEQKLPPPAPQPRVFDQPRGGTPLATAEMPPSPKSVPPPPAPTLVPPPPKPVSPAPPPPPAPSSTMAAVKPNLAAAVGPLEKETTQPTASATHRRNVGLVAVLGSIIGLIILGGSLVLLVLYGVRIPVLFPALNGLKTSGVAQEEATLALIAKKQSYQYRNTSMTTVQVQGSGTKPNLPSTDNGSSTATQVSSLTGTISSGESIIGSGQFKGEVDIASAPAAAVPVMIETQVGQDKSYTASYFKLNSTPQLGITKQADLSQTLLSAVLEPVPLETVLAAGVTETGYSVQTLQGLKNGIYLYKIGDDKLKTALPVGATLTNGQSEVAYAWKTGIPTRVRLAGTLTYLKQTYQYQAVYEYQNWNQDLSLSQLDPLSKGVDGLPTIPVSPFIGQLGIAIASMPNDLSADTLSETVEAKSPTGKKITAIADAITAIPPLPSAPASADAKQRDVQRKADLALIQSALEKYKTLHNVYPASSGLEQVQHSATLLAALVPTYLTALPIDPTENVYWYEYQSDGTTYVLRSVAEDPTDPTAKLGKAYSYFEFTNP